MTLAEVERAVLSWQRRSKRVAQEQAAYNYIMAALIGTNVASYFTNATVPPLTEVYSHLFEDKVEEVQEQKIDAKTELSALRFKQFAKSFNDRFNKREVANVSE
jgi:hypothetical protein